MSVKVYSFKDNRCVFTHPDVGTCVLSEGGVGRIAVSYQGEMARAMETADGNVIINKMEANSGAVQLDIPQVGDANEWLKKLCNYLRRANADRFALGTIVITSANDSITCTGVAPQKFADIAFDAEAQNRSWPFVCASIDMG